MTTRKSANEVKNKQISFRITETLRDQVQEKLEQDGISITDLLTGCLMDYVGLTPDTKKVVEDIKE